MKSKQSDGPIEDLGESKNDNLTNNTGRPSTFKYGSIKHESPRDILIMGDGSPSEKDRLTLEN